MNELWQVLLLSLLPGAGNFAGGLIAEFGNPSPRLLNWALHAASGIVIAIVAVELTPTALTVLPGWSVAAAFAAGGLLYVALLTGVERLRFGGRGRTRMWMIYIAVATDLASDGMVLGAGSAVSTSLALVLASGQILADVPEGYASMATFRAHDVPRVQRLWLSASFITLCTTATSLAHFGLRQASEDATMVALVIVAGLLTLAAVEDILTEAHRSHEDSTRSMLAFLCGFVLFTLVSVGLETVLPR